MTDLLLPKNCRFRRLVINKDKEHNIVKVEGATMVPVYFRKAKELRQFYYQGLDKRAMRTTEVNETSSRSHLIFLSTSDEQIKITYKL